MGTPDKADTTNTDISTPVSTDTSDKQTDWEKRFKDTQSAYTNSQKKLAEIEAQNKILLSKVSPTATLTEDQKNKLDEIKEDDPDAWRIEMNKLEDAARVDFQTALDTAAAEAVQQADTRTREEILAEFNSNTETPLTADILAYDIPQRITSKLDKGEITFEQYLSTAAEYLKIPKVIGVGTETMGQPNMSEAAGGHLPSDSAIAGDMIASYRDEIY